LPGGAAIEMKDDPVVIEQVAKQLLDHQPGTGGKACCKRAPEPYPRHGFGAGVVRPGGWHGKRWWKAAV
jgi:hypothetical protein